MKRIGVFAGVFDPVHDGHITLVQSARDLLELDQVVFMIEADPWTAKEPEATHQQRIEMVELALSDHGSFSVFQTSQQRFYVDKTLDELEVAFPDSEFYFIMGADSFLRMNSDWPGVKRMLTPPSYIVVSERGMTTESDIAAHARSLAVAPAVLPNRLPHHASSDVRSRIHDKALWLPKKVANYIDENHIYKN